MPDELLPQLDEHELKALRKALQRGDGGAVFNDAVGRILVELVNQELAHPSRRGRQVGSPRSLRPDELTVQLR